jgi:hypothetical protein
MMDRCYNPEHIHYGSYGGRGIAVCERWRDVANFIKDVGEKPPGKTHDRIDNNGNYEPENCRWASPKEQGRNRRDNTRITAFGKTKLLVEWSEETGLAAGLIVQRIKKGITPEIALTLPRDKYHDLSDRIAALETKTEHLEAASHESDIGLVK